MTTSVSTNAGTTRWWLWGLFGLALLLVLMIILPLWVPLFLAAVLSGATHRWYDRLRNRLRDRPKLAAALMAVGVVVIVLVPVSLVAALLVHEGIDAATWAAQNLGPGTSEHLLARLPAPLRRAASWIPLEGDALHDIAKAAGSTVADIARGVASGGASTLMGLVLVLVAYVAMLLHGPEVVARLDGAAPLPAGTLKTLLDEFRRTANSVIGSAAVSAAAQGFVALIGYLVVGLPSALLIAVLTGLAGLIPAVGTSLVVVPVGAWLLLTGQLWEGIFVLIWSIFVVGMVDNLVKPLVLRGGMATSGTLVFFALVGGLLAFGPIGLLVGPLSITFLRTMVRFLKGQGQSTEPISHAR